MELRLGDAIALPARVAGPPASPTAAHPKPGGRRMIMHA
jgi:hypothetical protein